MVFLLLDFTDAPDDNDNYQYNNNACDEAYPDGGQFRKFCFSKNQDVNPTYPADE